MKKKDWIIDSRKDLEILLSEDATDDLVEVEILPPVEYDDGDWEDYIEVETVKWPFQKECIDFAQSVFPDPMQLECEREIEAELERMSLAAGDNLVELGDKLLFLRGE